MKPVAIFRRFAIAVLLTAQQGLAQEQQDPWARVRSFDLDGDGKISRHEFRGPQQMFNRMDANSDGLVEEKEARSMRQRMRRTGGVQDAGGDRQQPGAMFLFRIDADHDERISIDEWTRFFETADENGDEILQAEEWQAAIRGQPAHDPAPEVGDPAPKVKVRVLDSDREVNLGDIRKPTVVVFGSYT